MNILIISISLVLAALFGQPAQPEYDLKKPDLVIVLPDTLHEISGISVSGSLIACVQDENGIIFLYDPAGQKISRQIRFGPDGDYEDIVWHNGSYYVLRSDGLLYQVTEKDDGVVSVSTYYTGVPAKDNEGLCYSSGDSALLIAAKSKSGKGKHHKSRRDVYMFDLSEKKLREKPVMVLDAEDVKLLAKSKGIVLPVKYSKKGRKSETVLKLTCSAIALHPLTHDIYVLSSTDRLLLVYGKDYSLKDIITLDPFRFNKAEGIDFSKDGKMYISNEGQHKKPTVLAFGVK